MKKGKKYEVDCYHKDCLLSFKTLKQRSLHHDKTEPECHNENLRLFNLTKQFHKFLTNFKKKGEGILEIDDTEKSIVSNLETIDSLDLIKNHHKDLLNLLKERGRDNYCMILEDLFPETKE